MIRHPLLESKKLQLPRTTRVHLIAVSTWASIVDVYECDKDLDAQSVVEFCVFQSYDALDGCGSITCVSSPTWPNTSKMYAYPEGRMNALVGLSCCFDCSCIPRDGVECLLMSKVLFAVVCYEPQGELINAVSLLAMQTTSSADSPKMWQLRRLFMIPCLSCLVTSSDSIRSCVMLCLHPILWTSCQRRFLASHARVL